MQDLEKGKIRKGGGRASNELLKAPQLMHADMKRPQKFRRYSVRW
jgi:hypothetical protein